MIITREEWGAGGQRGGIIGPVASVVIHHTAGGAPTTEDAEIREMQGMDRFHRETRGWLAIGYNFVIMPSGRIYEGRGWSRSGAHTRGHNSRTVGIAFAGNYSGDPPTDRAIESCRWLIAEGIQVGAILAGRLIGGHRDYDATECPGGALYALLPRIREPWKEPIEEPEPVDLPPIRPEPPALSTRDLGRLREIVRRVREAVRGR